MTAFYIFEELVLDLQCLFLNDDQHDHADRQNGNNTDGNEQTALGGRQNLSSIVTNRGFGSC